ncbi:MAG: substrate-binding domain-containing protein [Lachnospiraceae bacterium]|nr:substrate-binding domain-containing protein [Lachnospiraceae bacterium]
MKRTKMPVLLSALLMAALLSGCSQSGQDSSQRTKTEGLDQLKDIQVISREEGSGTRSAFAELVGFVGNEEGKQDLTTDKAQIAENAEEVCKLVGENTSAVGYISLGTVPEDGGIKVLKVNGTQASLEEKSYPLSRTFYLAYSGQLSELEQDFLSYVHGAGQDIVAEAYIPVAKSSSFLSNKAKGTLKIGGSTSVAPLIANLANAYMKINSNAKIIVQSSDSSDGLTKAMSGEFDFGMSSRDLKDYEMELLDYEAIAEDDIAVIVNAENPLEDITLEELKNVFTGMFVKWEELNQ